MLTIVAILLGLALLGIALYAMPKQQQAEATMDPDKREHRSQRLFNSSLWKQEEEIRYAATFWGLDNETDVDLSKLLKLTSRVKESMGEEFVADTVQRVLLVRHSTKTVIKRLSRRATQVIRVLDLVVRNTSNTIERFIQQNQSEGDTGNEESINV